MKSWLLSFLLLLPLLSWGEFKVPALTDPVMDQAGLMTTSDRQLLRQLIFQFHQLGKGQIQVLTVPDLGGIPIEQASIQVTDQWKLGDKKRDDGALILVAAQEHKMRIEVGQGLEGVLPDVTAKRIISDVMAPAFRQESPSRGILIGAVQVMKTIDPEFEPQAGSDVQPRGQGSFFDRYEGLIFLIFIIFMMFFNRLRPRRRSFWGGPWWGGGGLGGFGGGFGGGGWGGGSSGGGWSGGGGGFSGGGASGDW